MTADPQQPPRVFISYSQESEAHIEHVLTLAHRLRSDGMDVRIDQDEPVPSRGWPVWMEKQIERADFIICVCTESYLRRVNQQEKAELGRGVTWEATLLRNQLYEARGENRRVLPVIFEPDAQQFIPYFLKHYSFFETTTSKGYTALLGYLTNTTKADEQPSQRLEMPIRTTSLNDKSLHLLDPYRSWARDRYGYLDMIGIDTDDVQVPLDEIYVPLKLVHHRSPDSTGPDPLGNQPRGQPTSVGGAPEVVEIHALLRTSRSVLIFGEPGSGKTIALKKLHQLCWEKASDLGLAPETVPIFLSMRNLSPELLEKGLPAFIEQEILQLSGRRLQGFGEKLWKHRKLLLLLDGLDEIPDPSHRAEVLRILGWLLEQDDANGVRLAVTCRRAGLPDRETDRDQPFRIYEVQPFRDRQIKTFIERWFRELAERGRIGSSQADRQVNTILEALKDRRQAGHQQFLEMMSNPLLLNLLCVVVLLDNEVSTKRVRFYEQCLDVLLERLPKQQKRVGPLNLTTARVALGHLAFHLHVNQQKEGLSWAKVTHQFKLVLGDLTVSSQFLDWIHQVGLLVQSTESKQNYSFMHLGFQEHLTARHLVDHPEDLAFLRDGFEEPWWKEVFLQLSALSDREGFPALTRELLEHSDLLERNAGLLRECLEEASHPDLSAFLQVLRKGESQRQSAVLRLLVGTDHRPSELLEVLKPLTTPGNNLEVRSLAEQILSTDSQESGKEIALLFSPQADQSLAEDLAQRLKNWQGGWPVSLIDRLGQDSNDELENCSLGVVLVGYSQEEWSDLALLPELFDHASWIALRLPGDPPPQIPEALSEWPILEWELNKEDNLVEAILSFLSVPLEEPPEQLLPKLLEQPQQGVPGKRPETVPLGTATVKAQEAFQPYEDPVSGALFLWVPGGSFLMGSDEMGPKEKPPHIVRVSPFWLAQTPVTNEQYGRFLAATNHPEPLTWRNRRFSTPQQPVLNVSWEDAAAYCRWLSKAHPQGDYFELPSEAQWEFAARGTENRRFPWGETMANEALACHGLDWNGGQPLAVGSYPKGAGPFGHLDLAGLVWEWCRDSWEKDYSRWQGIEAVDPLGNGGPDVRPLRGGSWGSGSGDLRAAFRFGLRPWYKDDFTGFRVLCASRT